MRGMLMGLRVLFLVVIVLGIVQFVGLVPAGSGSLWTWVHVVAGLAMAAGMVLLALSALRGTGALPTGGRSLRPFILGGLALSALMVGVGLTQLLPAVGAGAGSAWTWLHIIAGLGAIGLTEMVAARRPR